jgi:hypothetical protein
MSDETKTMTLTDFLLARIAEDEAAANYANTGVRWESWNRSWDTEPQRDIAGGGIRLFTVPTLYDEHVARHDPGRVLADCEAKRRIVESYQWYVDHANSPNASASYGEHLQAERHARYLAATYADHPDYHPDWRP